MAYTSENAPMREMTPNDHLAQAAARLAQVASELSEHGGIVNTIRNDLRQAEGSLARSQSEFNDALGNFRSLLDQYGLDTMNVPEVPQAYKVPR
jgi:ABC-type transporter Mla subunit MlaD